LKTRENNIIYGHHVIFENTLKFNMFIKVL